MGATPHWVTLVLACLATYRITRFVTKDAFPLVAVPRDWVQEKWDPFDDKGWENWRLYTGEERVMLIAALRDKGIPRPSQLRRSLAYLVTCAWCVSIWVGAGVTAFTVTVIHEVTWQWAPLVWLATSAVTGLISQREPE